MKGKKRKKAQGKYDHEEEDKEPQPMEASKRPMIEKNSNSQREEEQGRGQEKLGAEAEEASVNGLVGIPIPLSERKSDNTKITFVLERASLEVAKVGKVRNSFS